MILTMRVESDAQEMRISPARYEAIKGVRESLKSCISHCATLLMCRVHPWLFVVSQPIGSFFTFLSCYAKNSS
jgi:hypothetical protein